MRSKIKYNTLLTGLIPGLIMPIIFFILIWQIAFSGSIGEYVRQFQHLNRVASLVSLSVLPNLLLFFIFIWTERYLSARGVIMATIIMALIMLLIKFL